MREDPDGLAALTTWPAEFARVARTPPERAAEIIHQGVEKGKARILVGPDAYFFDLLARLAPTRYYDVLKLVERALRSRAQRADRP